MSAKKSNQEAKAVDQDIAAAEAKAKQSQEEAAKIEELNIKEITDKINAAKTVEDLEALQPRVHEIWEGNVPEEIQILAASKGDEITKRNPLAPVPTPPKSVLQQGWKKVTMEEVKAAEKSGKLAGFDDKTMLANILN